MIVTQKIELGDEIIVIEGKIRKKPLDKLENERNIIIKSDIYRVGYSRELYGKEIYNSNFPQCFDVLNLEKSIL